MSNELGSWLLLALAMPSAVVAGVFMTFSDLVMPSLGRGDAATGSAAMQMINRKVYRSVFLVLLVGLVPVSAAAAIAAAMLAQPVALPWLAAAASLYLFGVFGVTVVANVPMNIRLDGMSLAGGEAQAYWPDYVGGWLPWNHLRTLAAAGTAVCYMIAAVLLAQAG
ncbi:MAG: DUF1772 domain-containing protein [Minwuia sp.]|nr:DUF1772 domain-containing protein [Minwuia sp.]